MYMASPGNKAVALPYQAKFLADNSRFRGWLASRQIGKSWAIGLDAAIKSQDEKKSDIVLLSASQRQSRALMKKFYMHLKALRQLTRAEKLAIKENKEECELKNGNTVISLPANPDTARGFSAHVYLDEFAIHKDSREIWKALFGSITRGYSMTVASTPMGKQGKFWDLYSKNKKFSWHKTTIEDAAAQGLEVDIEELKEGLDDEEAWQQEYLCEFLDELSAFLSHDLITACEYDPDIYPMPIDGDRFLGMDIGRKKDLSVMFSGLAVANTIFSQEVKVLEKMPFSQQRTQLYERLERVRRACIDASGLGMQLAEEAKEKFGSKVEPVTFSAQVKESLAYQLKAAMEDRRIRIPLDRDIHNSFHAIKKVITASNNIRFDVDSAHKKDHGDYFWAAALMLEASSTPIGKVEHESVKKRRMAEQRGAF
jgi:phage FluMu gp28-like protein